MIDRYMLPMGELKGVTDSSYFLRKNLSFVFAQGYCHPRGGFYGKLINYPDANGPLDIFGHRYGTTNKRMVSGKLELIPIDEQLEIHYRVEPALARSDKLPPFAEYHTEFRLDDCVGFFDHRKSLRVAMEMYPQVKNEIKKVTDFFEVPVEQLGVTGSLAYGKMEPEHEDIDLVIYGSLQEHKRLIEKITEWLKAPENRVFEFGRFWPMRFYYDGTLICPFFVYSRPDEVPLAEFKMKVLKDNIPFRARVCDDTHSIYLPIMLYLEDAILGGKEVGKVPLIIYDSAMRGDFRLGDRMDGFGKLVEVQRGKERFQSLLVTSGTKIKKL